ncbi:MAG: peptidylprolyl isomerase [Gammaproteobacteria bacterium]
MVTISTSMGDITLELYEDKAPITVKNFLEYVDAGHYDGTIFHRVIDEFMIQGGGFEKDMQQKPTLDPIKNEADNGLSNEPYTISMARTQDVNSATAQFFINVADNTTLDHGGRDFGYCVFGKVTDGERMVEQISVVKTMTRSGMKDVPVDPVIINSIKRT